MAVPLDCLPDPSTGSGWRCQHDGPGVRMGICGECNIARDAKLRGLDFFLALLLLRCALSLNRGVGGHRGTYQRLERGLVEFFTLANVDGAARVAFKTGIE